MTFLTASTGILNVIAGVSDDDVERLRMYIDMNVSAYKLYLF
jgi:hypothetical protein